MLKLLTIFFLLFSININAAPDGAHLFEQHCAVCHGSKGGGGVGIPLSLPSFLSSVDDQFLLKTIRIGRPGRVMPAFPYLSDAQIAALVNYIRSWSNEPAPVFSNETVKGDLTRGKSLFKDYCSQCHGENGEGGHGTGVTFSRKRDLPIMPPALNNIGFLSSASDQLIKHTLMIGRDDTPMVSLLVRGLEENDINDIVSYVRSFQSTVKSNLVENPVSAVLTQTSSYSFEETLASVKEAITNLNFTLIREVPFEEGMVEPGQEMKKQVVFHFCNFKFLYDALAIDPRVGMFLPCRATVTEHDDGLVVISTINPLFLSRIFNNEELNHACKQMYAIYQEFLEEI